MTGSLTVAPVETAVLSVVMVTHGGGDTAVDAIEALIRNTPEPFELVIVDNASPDETSALLQARITGAKIVVNDDNVGFARASNQGALLASAPYLCFLNPDSFVQENWLAPLLRAFERDESVGAAVPVFVYLDGRIQEAGSAVDSNGVAFSIGDGDDLATFAYRFPRTVDFGSAACLVVRADVFQDVGGFDPVYTPAYYEDADLCFRLKEHGFDTVYEPASRVTHLRGGSTPRASRLTRMNRRIFAERWSERLERRRPLRADQDNPRIHTAHRDAEQLERILIVDDRVPHHDRGSGDPRMAKLVAEVADLWPEARVTFLAAIPDNAERYAAPLLERGVEVALSEEHAGTWLEQRRFHYSVVLLSRASNIERFHEELRRTQPQARRIYDIEALAFRRHQPEDERATRLRHLERVGIDSADVVLAVSDEEASFARELTEAPVFVLPTYVQPLEHPPGYADRSGVAFFGGFLVGPGGPNEEAAVLLVEEVMPRLWEARPELELEILGANPTPAVRELQGRRVEVVGFVPDPLERLARPRVHIHPLRTGAGIKLKLIDTMAAGLPFVTTPTGAEGLGLGDLEAVLIADDPSDLARLALDLYENAELWSDVQARLLDLAAQRFGRTEFRRTLVEAFAQVGVAPPRSAAFSAAV